MKIGIITQPLLNNYGGLLQNYALQNTLIKLGHDVETIDWNPIPASKLRVLLWQYKQGIISHINKSIEKPRYQLSPSELSYISKNTKHFIDGHISVCPIKVNNQADFKVVDFKYHYDAYVVGSDQVWRPGYNAAFLPAMFLDFVSHKDIKKVAYAASFGTSTWEFSAQQTTEFSLLAKQFDLITVREDNAVDLCKEYLGVAATHVLDPTMLLDKEEYEDLVFEEKESQSNGTLFYYILDPSANKTSLIREIERSEQLNAFTVMPSCQSENRTKSDVKNRIDDCVFPSVTKWIRGFMDAKMVIVDSFHGAVFSILFNKPFWVINNNDRGNARFASLLKMFGLQDRMINNDTIIQWNKPIDWDRVNHILEVRRQSSLDLLKHALE